MLLESLLPRFETTALTRGAEYVRLGRVTFKRTATDGFTARVKGTRDYTVQVHLLNKAPGVEWSCSCPFFAQHGPCKHLWAGLLAAQDFLGRPEGALPIKGQKTLGPLAKRPADREDEHFDPDPTPEDEELDDGWDAEFDLFDDEDEEEEVDPWSQDTTGFQDRPGQPRRPYADAAIPAPRDWRGMLGAIHQESQFTPNPSALAQESQILYVMDMAATLAIGALVILIVTRRPRKNGQGWTMLRPLTLPVEAIGGLPDPADRRILGSLVGCQTHPYGYGGSRRIPESYKLTPPMLDQLLPEMVQTGRLGWLPTEVDNVNEPLLLGSDIEHPWHFELQVETDAARASHVIRGVLRRDGETLPLAAPQWILQAGWMILTPNLCRLAHGNHFAWIFRLRHVNEILVPISQTGEWMQTMLTLPRPVTHFPEAIAYREEQGTPKPKLTLHTRRASHGNRDLGATVTFRYATTDVSLNDRKAALVDEGRQTLLLRDRQQETIFVQQLWAAGLRPPGTAAEWAYEQPIHAEIRATALPNAVHSLIAAGWEIEAQGVPYRRSGSLQVSVRSGIDWFDIEGQAAFGDQVVAMPKLLQALRKGERTIRLGDGSVGILPEAWMQQLGLLAGAVTLEANQARFRRSQAFLLDALLSQQPGATWDEAFDRIRTELQGFSGVEPRDPPEGFKGSLRDYQRAGLGWFSLLQRFGFGGCLADDMGLGKTVQALALLLERQRAGAGPSLIVVPRSVVVNWLNEAARFAPELEAVTHTDPGRAQIANNLAKRGIIITTYAILRLDIEMLRTHTFDYVILDEAQAIKNSGTATAKAARLLQSNHRLAMSGTPIENHLGELWSLFEFLNPGMLGASRAFEGALKQDGMNISDDVRLLLSKAIKPFVLRRTKQQVATELPEKQEETIFCTLPATQRQLYDELREHYRAQLQGKIEQAGLERSKIMVLEALLRLRQAACHPGLVDPARRRQSSAKLELLLEQIEDITQEDHKVLVFSQFVKMLDIVRDRLTSRGIVYEYLDGSTRDRAERVARFQTDAACPVFLISLKAGGVGLNLTAADYVILLDPWWNPAVEAQAIDRTHRIGQTRKVLAYRLVAKDTVEERILALQDKKRALADSIIQADTSLLRNLTRDDLELLLS